MLDVYERCPVYESNSFKLRLVKMEDAEDLLACYSDPEAVRFMNADHCTSDFYYRTVDEMRQCVAFWLRDYAGKAYVRYAVVTKASGRAVGTIEMFGGDTGKEAEWGMLRIDLAGVYERAELIGELLDVACARFYREYNVKNIVTKAVEAAGERRSALGKHGFISLEEGMIRFDRPVDGYFIRPAAIPNC